MRRINSDAGGRTESSTELIARINAERASRSTETTGRRRRAATSTIDDGDTEVIERIVDDATGLDGRIPDQRDESSGESSAERTGATVAVLTADERPDEQADIVQDAPLPGRAARRRRAQPTTMRRLAPLAVGAAAMLMVTTLVTLIPQGEQDQVAAPELSGQVVADTPEPPDYLEDYTPPTTTPLPVPTPVPTPVVVAPEPPPAAAPEPPPAPKAPVKNEGTTAASVHGWKLVGGDEFNNGLNPTWGEYDGAGHGGNGRRSPDHVSVENGNLVLRGDGNGNTGGVAWKDGQRFGRWEMRARFPKGDAQYHPVLILWPSAENWPEGGEVDFAETTSASNDVAFFLHYGAANNQVDARKNLDITQYHNYAVEWVDGRITGFIDGQKWFESTDGNQMPPGDMQPTIQLDYFPEGGNPQPSEMVVDFMRIYE